MLFLTGGIASLNYIFLNNKKNYFPHFSKMNLKVTKKDIKSPTLVKYLMKNFAFQKEFKKSFEIIYQKALGKTRTIPGVINTHSTQLNVSFKVSWHANFNCQNFRPSSCIILFNQLSKFALIRLLFIYLNVAFNKSVTFIKIQVKITRHSFEWEF